MRMCGKGTQDTIAAPVFPDVIGAVLTEPGCRLALGLPSLTSRAPRAKFAGDETELAIAAAERLIAAAPCSVGQCLLHGGVAEPFAVHLDRVAALGHVAALGEKIARGIGGIGGELGLPARRRQRFQRLEQRLGDAAPGAGRMT